VAASLAWARHLGRKVQRHGLDQASAPVVPHARVVAAARPRTNPDDASACSVGQA
jgi:hypothetical protein